LIFRYLEKKAFLSNQEGFLFEATCAELDSVFPALHYIFFFCHCERGTSVAIYPSFTKVPL
jgi:hypothetical protein